MVYYDSKRIGSERHYSESFMMFAKKIWVDFFKNQLDSLSSGYQGFYKQIKSYYDKANWLEVYDLIEFIAQNHPYEDLNKIFIELCNKYLKRELSAYRFVGNLITPITNEQEIAEIEEVLKYNEIFRPVKRHIKTALDLFSIRESPDYKNSIKESISAVEAICKLITQNKKATLGDALKIIEREGKIELHPALKSAFVKLYGYTSNADGIRHGSGLMDDPNLDFEDAKFMLVSCSSFINYLKEKINKAKIKIQKL